MRALIKLLCPLIMIAGCSTGDSSPKTPAEFATQLSSTGCLHQSKCGYIATAGAKQCELDAAAAAAKYTGAYSQADAVTAGRLTYDAKAAAACITAYQAAGCMPDLENAASTLCDKSFLPAVPVGGTCEASAECVGGFCVWPEDSGTTGCPGTCKAYLPTGGDCSVDGESCTSIEFCDDTTNTCTPRKMAGAECAGWGCRLDLGLSCQGTEYDQDDNVTKNGTCQAPGGVGTPCAVGFFGDTNCTPGLWCDDTAGDGVCANRLLAGAACQSDWSCQDGNTCTGLTFDDNYKVTADGVCTAFLAVGGTCSTVANSVSGCAYNMTCDANTATCAIQGLEGADCSEVYCQQSLFCDPTSTTCLPLAALGQTCIPADPQDIFGSDNCHDGACDPTTKLCTLGCL